MVTVTNRRTWKSGGRKVERLCHRCQAVMVIELALPEVLP